LVTGSQYPRDRNSSQARRRRRRIHLASRHPARGPLLLLFGVLLGREANPVNIFLDRKKKKNQAKSMINNKKEKKKKEKN
jgi:hypothetical protein